MGNDANTLRVSMDLGPAEQELQTYPDDHFDALITDPPYGLGDASIDVDALLRSWAQDQDVDMGSGFMDAGWDQIPPPSTWDAIRRVIKPDRPGAVFAGTRTWDLMMVSLKLGGFVVEDCWRWQTGQGFPKNFNVLKHLVKKIEARYGRADIRCECVPDAEWTPDGEPDPDHNRPRAIIPDNYGDHALTTRVCSWCLKPDDAFLRRLNGKGTAFKPSYEPMLVVRKPTEPRDDQQALLRSYGVETESFESNTRR